MEAPAARKAAPVNKVEDAHQMYRDGCYEEALGLYTDALSVAKTRVHKIALHSNRAACYLKLHDFKKAADECTLVLELDNKHTGALMLRAQTLVALKEYQSALFDVNRLLDLNPLSEVYMELQTRLKTQLSLAPIPESEAEHEEEEEEEEEEDDNNNRNHSKAVEEQNQAAETRQTDHTSEEPNAPVREGEKETSGNQPKAWQTIPQPKGHSRLDYSRWDKVEDDSSEDDEDDSDDEETQPRYRFRVKSIGV